MSDVESSWENRMAALWDTFDDHAPDDFVAQVERLAAELPPHNSIGLFERASAHDSTGRPDIAVPLYRDALNAGLGGRRRREATIQLASSLRSRTRSGRHQPHRTVRISAAIQSVARALCERAYDAS